jgi:NADPH:quinone reductase-like Zn-dependent oxidoreductase
VRYAIDPVGGETGTQVFNSLAADGTMLVYGTLSGEPIRVDPRKMIAGKRLVQGFWLGHWMRGRSIPKSLAMFRDIAHLMREGVLTSEIKGTLPLDQVVQAVQEAEKVGKAGKYLLRIAER